jgi:GH15 family glucan-1,4-alpha-glucosidase
LRLYSSSYRNIAAPTTSLPEQVGGERNWDYRFTWVRDASFSVYALLGLGYTDEALAFLRWLRDRVGERAGHDSGPLKIMYRIDGSSDLREETLSHLEGYRGSAPVHWGTGRRISCSSTSTARPWIPCIARSGTGSGSVTRRGRTSPR